MLFRSRSIIGIARDTLEFAVSASEDTHPTEFMGVLRTTPSSRLEFRSPPAQDGDVVTDVLMIPGTKSGEMMASMREDMIPTNVGGVGTVHSHPSGSVRPSEEDLRTFAKKGKRHIIIGYPYDLRSWQCYDSEGQPVDLPVYDVEFEDDVFEEFFEEEI